MPICTFCTHSVSYLYTVYESEYNLRLEQCPNPKCLEFVDPYVEHDSLTILLDLFLLKRGVYRHLLYNRGSKPRKLAERKTTVAESKGTLQNEIADLNESNDEFSRWLFVLQLGCPLILVDSFIRWGYLNASGPPITTPWTKHTLLAFLRVFMGTVAETVAFHGGITLTCYIIMKFLDVVQSWARPTSAPKSSIRQHFHLSLISLSLFYSSLTKLFLLFLLTIWLPTPTTSFPRAENSLPEWANLFWRNESTNYILNAMEVFDDDKLDREWIVRNIVGGMSAGFGLRVILDIHPFFTTVVILAGWTAKTVVATLVSRWVGGDEMSTQAWLAYSIP
ncbi:hypothetical protein CVT25_009540 [Psilocybe cyanescens]|uniref:Protein ARV n=1 Tax=Psilocybe cyanescens TaxID=93625 RepID=A0A409XV82_PSICY|nr:hypothetical protein CVT25_009540 [Psilocybe cyanescens]